MRTNRFQELIIKNPKTPHNLVGSSKNGIISSMGKPKEAQGTPEQTTFENTLQLRFRGLVLDMLFTRWHSEELDRLLDLYQKGDLDACYILGFVSTHHEAKVCPEHYGAGRNLWDYVTKEMYPLLQAKYGNQVGSDIYRQLFGFLFENQDLVADGELNQTLVLSWLSSLEAALGHIEQTIFISAGNSTKTYLESKIQETEANVQVFRIALVENGGELKNGRRVDQEYIDGLEKKIRSYNEALNRLKDFQTSVGKIILES